MKSGAVIALTLVDAEDPARILVGVRDSKNNAVHPMVVSTPTQRVPAVVLEQICSGAAKLNIDTPLDLNFPEQVMSAHLLEAPKVHSRSANGHDPLIYAVESILSKKLGLSAPLEERNVHFTATPVSLLVGNIFSDDESKECLTLCNVRVLLENATLIPKSTPSYSRLFWIQEGEFLEMTRRRDLIGLEHVLGGHSAEYCVHGLCILSSFVHLNAL